MRPRQMHPDVLVAVQELLLGPGPSVHHLGDVQLIARAVRPQDRIADVRVEGMAEDLLAEDARPCRHARDLPHAISVEVVDRRVQIGAVGAHLLEDRIDLRVEAREQVGVEHSLDDHGAVLAETAHDVFGRRAGDKPGYGSAHLFSSSGPDEAAATRYGMAPPKYCHFVRNFLKSGQGESHGPTWVKWFWSPSGRRPVADSPSPSRGVPARFP